MDNNLVEICSTTHYNKCNKHNDIYIRKNLPCPYPNCENGIKEDKFIDFEYKIQDKKITKEIKHLYTRKKFKGIENDYKYIWLKEDDLFPSISNIIVNEVHVINKWNIIESIYHYTKLDNLYSILNSNELWLTEYTAQTDSIEVVFGFDLFSKYDKNDINISKKLFSKNLSFFLTCFSYESECRTLFNLYSDYSQGVSIEFDSNFNIDNNFWYSDDQLLQLMPVIYDDQIQRKIVDYCIYLFNVSEKWIDMSKDTFNNKNELITKYKRKEVIKISFKNKMEELLSFFKHYSYKDEREVRWLYRKDDEFINEYYGECLNKRSDERTKKHIILQLI